MIRVEAFRYWHIHAIDSAIPLPCGEETRALMDGREDEWAMSGVCKRTERVLWCVGVKEAWFGRGVAWGRVSQRMDFGQLRRTVVLVRELLDGIPYERIDCVADLDFPQAGRLLEAWGFTCEAPRMAKFKDGKDFALYALVR